MTRQTKERRIRIVPYVVGFILSPEQVETMSRRVHGDDIVGKYLDRPHVPLARDFEDKDIWRTVLPLYSKQPDGSENLQYCYVFDVVPSFNGKNPRPEVNKAAARTVWQEVGGPMAKVQCCRWPDLAAPDWFEDCLNEHFKIIRTKQEQNKGKTDDEKKE